MTTSDANEQRLSGRERKQATAKPLHGLTGFQRDLLRTIAALGESHGLGVEDDLEDDYGREIEHPTLYANLDRLCNKGLVEKGEADGRTNTYRLTDHGVQERRAHLEWELEADGGEA